MLLGEMPAELKLIYLKNSTIHTLKITEQDLIDALNNDLISCAALDVFNQHHGNIDTFGFKFNNRFAYSTDVVEIPEKNFKLLKDFF